MFALLVYLIYSIIYIYRERKITCFYYIWLQHTNMIMFVIISFILFVLRLIVCS